MPIKNASPWAFLFLVFIPAATTVSIGSRFQKRGGCIRLPGLESCHSQTKLIKSRVPPRLLGRQGLTVNAGLFRAWLAVCEDGSTSEHHPILRGRGPLEGIGPTWAPALRRAWPLGSLEPSSIPCTYRRGAPPTSQPLLVRLKSLSFSHTPGPGNSLAHRRSGHQDAARPTRPATSTLLQGREQVCASLVSSWSSTQ